MGRNVRAVAHFTSLLQKTLRKEELTMLTTLQVVTAALVALATPNDAPTQATVILAAQFGVTPESLVVAGFTAVESSAIVEELGTNGDYAAMLTSAQSLCDAKAAALTSAEAALGNSPGNQTLVAARNTARAELASAQAALKAVPGSARTALLAEADPGKRALLETFIAGAAHSVPPEFKAILRSESEWIELAGALRAEQRAARRGEELAEAKATLLSEARSNQTVAAARARLDNTLTAVRTAFTPAQQ